MYMYTYAQLRLHTHKHYNVALYTKYNSQYSFQTIEQLMPIRNSHKCSI